MISRHTIGTSAARALGAGALCVLFGACASQQVPAKDLADSEAAVRAATELGAKGTPEAALHLQLAKDRLERAKSQNEKGDGASAKALLEEAKADAELALVLTREQDAERDAQAAQQRLDGVRHTDQQPPQAQ